VDTDATNERMPSKKGQEKLSLNLFCLAAIPLAGTRHICSSVLAPCFLNPAHPERGDGRREK